MADQTTNYVIAVADKIDAGIEGKLQRISTAANSAGGSCTTLQQQINNLNANGITSVSQALRSTTDTTRILSTATTTYGSAALTAATRTTAFSNSLVRLTANASLASARLAGLATAATSVTGASQNINAAASSTASSLTGVGRGATGAAGGVRGMTAVLGVAEGRLTSSNRLAAAFLSTLVGSGPIVAAAFSVLGALALLAVLAQVAQAIYHVVEAYKAQSLAARQASDDAILSGEKIVKVQASLFTASNAARLLRGNGLSTDTVEIQSAQAALKQLSYQREILASQNALNQAGLTGDALAKARIDSVQRELDLAKQQKQAADTLTSAYKAQLEATRTRTATQTDGLGRVVGSTQHQELSITDDKQVKAIQTEMRSAKQASDDLGTSIIVLGNNLKAAGKKETLAAVKDDAKDARLEIQRLDAEYKNYVAKLDHKVTPNETLDYWQKSEAHLRHYSANIDAVNAKEAAPLQAIASRNDNLGRTTENLDDQIANIGAYSDALKEKQQLDKLTIEYQKTGIPLTAAETAALKIKIATVVENATYQAELNKQYKEASGPLDTYINAQKALQKLTADDPANAARYAAQLNVVGKEYKDATQPLYEYAHGIQQQIILLGQYGTALTVATEIQRIGDTLRAKGQSLTAEQYNSLKTSLTQLEQAKQVQSDINAMYEKNAGALEKLTIAQRANNEAYLSGVISAQQYKNAAIAAGVAQAELANDRGLGTLTTRLEAALGTLSKGFTTIAAGADKAFVGFFSTLDNGFADSIGHVIAFGGSMKTALLDTARQAVAGLISSLIKLGIQYLITTVLAKAFNISLPKSSDSNAKETLANTAASIAAIAAVTAAQFTAIDLLTGPAWDLAEAVSLFSFGANAAGAEAGIASVVAAGQAAQHFATGGPVRGPGTAGSDSIPARLSNGEYVVNARATSQNYALIDAINNGGKVMHYASGGYVAGTQMQQSMQTGSGINVNVVHDGSTAIEVRQGPTAQDMQIIAKNAVYQHTDDAVAGVVGNGNSKTRQALQQNTTATPRRN